MVSVPFYVPQLHLLSFIAAVPFFYIILGEGAKNIIRSGVIFAMSFYLSVYTWFLWMYPMEQVGVTPGESLFIVIAAWIGFPILQMLVFLILPLGLKLIKPDNIMLTPVLCASLYVMLEWVQSWFLTGLTWGKLAVSQYRDLAFIQSMSLLGTYFPAFIIIFINSALALWLLRYRAGEGRAANGLILACVLLYAANACFGMLRLRFYDYSYERITAQIVQGNISSYEKWEERGVDNSLDIYRDLTNAHSVPDAKIIVWPETAIPMTIRRRCDDYNKLLEIAVSNNIVLMTGIFYSEVVQGEQKTYNAIVAFGEGIGFVRPYAKRQLVPFGEYLPLGGLLPRVLPFIENIALFRSQLTPGEDSRLMRINGVNYGGLVCFDSIFPRLARRSTRDGADILIIVTNDSWFRDSRAIYQHNAQAVLRAVSNNRYVVRSANTGISSFISSTGRILEQTQVFERVVITQEVGLVRGVTLYTRVGEITLYLAGIFIVFCAALRFKAAKARRDLTKRT